MAIGSAEPIDFHAKLEALEGIVRWSPLAIAAVDRNHTVHLWNAQCEIAFGWNAAEVLGKPLPIIPGGREGEFHGMLESQLQGEETPGLELRCRRKDGTLVDLYFRSAPLWNAAGEITGILAMFGDVSDQRNAEEKPRKAPDELESRVRARTAELLKTNEELQGEIRSRQELEDALHRSEERFRLLVEGVSEYAIYMLDPNGIVESWNGGAARIKGYGAEEILGQHFSRFYADEDRANGKPERDLGAAAQTGHIEIEGWRRRKDDSRFWANSTISALYDSAGRIRGFASVTKDITGKKQAAEERERLLAAIDAQRQLFQAVVEHAPAGIAIYDGETCRVKWANPTYRDRLDEPYRSMDIVGRRLQEILPGAEKAGIVEIFHSVASTGIPHFEPEQELVGLNQGTTYWRWSLLPLGTADGPIRDLMILVVDVTDQVVARRRIEELAEQLTEERQALSVINRELDLRNREVERANRLKSEFLASMSHELRTPLHSIIGFSELLSEQESGALNAKQKRQLEHILRGSRHLLSLINDILDLSKIEAGRLELQRESFLAQPAMSEVMSTIEPMASPKKIRIENEVDGGLVVWADRLRFKQILYNLLSNAVKFTPEDGAVSISCSDSGESIEFAVSDTGIGIPLEEQKAIFDEFHQAATSTRGVREGTGLGLAITRRLVEKHGGEIRLDSKPGVGSRFAFSLPLALRAGKMEGVEGTAAGGHTGRAPILVVDDELSARELLVTYLNSDGFPTVTAKSGEEAVRKARELRPEAITLDVVMRGGSGWETLKQLKSDPATASIPVLIVSVLDEKRTGFSLGAAEYLIKPVSKRGLLEALVRHVSWPEGGSLRVLVVDGDPEELQLVAQVLRSDRITPTTATDGQQALEGLAKAGADGLVLNLPTPEMGTLDLLRQIRSDARFRELPVFVLTARDLTPPELALLDLPVEAVVTKTGAWRHELQSRIRSVLQKQTAPRCTKVVVADDNRESREFLRDVLDAKGFQITEALDGKDALARIHEVLPDIVFLDIQMPRMDGYATLRAIRQDPRFAKLPVVALTAFAMHGDRDKALAAGFNGYISKPVDPRSLRLQVEGLLQRRESEPAV